MPPAMSCCGTFVRCCSPDCARAIRWRGLAVSLQSTGYALGATLGGLLAVWLLGHWGWRSVFLFGGIVTVLVIPLVLLWLPESLDFLLARRPANALARVNRLAVRLGQPALAQLPAVAARAEGASRGFKQLLAPAMRRTTLVIWLLFFLVMFGFYFVMSWTPKLLVAAGLSAQQGITGGVLLSVGGILGAALIGGLASRWPLTRVLALFMLITAALLVLFVANGASVTAALALGLLIGLFSNGCVAGLYALSPVVYDASVRATGVGWRSWRRTRYQREAIGKPCTSIPPWVTTVSPCGAVNHAVASRSSRREPYQPDTSASPCRSRIGPSWTISV